jgi:hypothetical protein
MAAKKRKVKATRKKAPRARPASRKKTSPVRKKAVARKPQAPRKKPAARRVPEARGRKPAAGPSAPAAAPAAAPLPGEERVGIVTHYFGDLSVAAVRMESGSLRLGDTIHIRGHTSDFQQQVDSMQVDHEPVSDAAAGQEIGLRVTQHAREHDVVYKVAAPLR